MLTQADRYIRVTSPLGADVLLLESFEGTEGVSVPFQFELGMLTENASLDMTSLLGQPLAVTIRLPDDSDRVIHGLVSRIEEIESGIDGLTGYRAEMVPWFWFLSLFQDCRIFQNKSALDIVKKVFTDRGFTDFEDRTTGTYAEREYCVQYRESDLNFVSRLLEEEGVFYFFEHTNEKHTLVLADQTSSFVPCPGQSSAAYDTTAGMWQDEDVVLDIRRTQRVRVGQVTVNDYDFTKPKTSLDANLSDATRKGEFYEYPAKYNTRDIGTQIARVRLEEQEVKILTINGKSNCRAFQTGYRFSLTGHFRADANKDYTLLSIHHNAGENTYRSGDGESFDYRNEFEAMPQALPFRPPRLARKPVVQGSQTAVVVGKSGEEIWVDQYGRVKVQFFWDRAGQMDENSSCWVRVAQLWAGKGWGAIFTPRIGQEVIVDFLEGDPDRPIITGRVYNADQTTPYALPDEQTKSAIKSMSSKGGGGFNEIRLEDKAGSEQIFIHGEKDLDIRIKNDEHKNIDRNLHLVLKQDHFEHVKNDRHVTIDNDLVQKVGRDHHLNVIGKQALKVGESHSFQVTGDVTEVFQQSHSEKTTMDVYINAGLGIVFEATTGITLKCGSNSVVIDPVGVTIKGSMVVIDGQLTNINSGPGSPAKSGTAGTAVSPTAPKEAQDADTADPGQMSQIQAQQKQEQKGRYGTVVPVPFNSRAALADAAASSAPAPLSGPATDAPAAAATPKTWIEIKLVDKDGLPVPGEYYRIKLTDGSVAEGTLDADGHARVDGIDPGSCEVTFPHMDQTVWEPQ